MKVYTENMIIPLKLTVTECNVIWDALYGRRAGDYKAGTDRQEIANKYDALMDKVNINKIFAQINNLDTIEKIANHNTSVKQGR